MRLKQGWLGIELAKEAFL